MMLRVKRLGAILILCYSSFYGLLTEGAMLTIPEIGNHHKIITFEKNENPQNIMVIYTKLDEQCRFVMHEGRPLVDFYWLMDRKRYKPTHHLIKDAVRKRLIVENAKEQQFEMRLNDLSELKAKITNPNLIVKAEKSSGACRVVSYFTEDKSAEKLIEVATLFSESKKTLLPPFRKLMAITVRGKLPESGEAIQRRYVAL